MRIVSIKTALYPTFSKGDLLLISPETWTRSGDIGGGIWKGCTNEGNCESNLHR